MDESSEGFQDPQPDEGASLRNIALRLNEGGIPPVPTGVPQSFGPLPLDQLLGAGGSASGARQSQTEDAARTAVNQDPLQDVLAALTALQSTVGALATSQQALNAQMNDLKTRVESQQMPSGNVSAPSGAASGPSSGFSMPSMSMPSGVPCASPYVPSGGFSFPGAFQVPQMQQVGPRAWGTQDTSLRGVDAKLIPSMPTVNCDAWKSRPQEICGFHSYLESLTSWLSTLAPNFGPEIREIMQRRHELMDHELSEIQHGRSQRLYYILKQVLSHSVRCLGIIRVYEGGRLERAMGSSCCEGSSWSFRYIHVQKRFTSASHSSTIGASKRIFATW